MTYHAVRNLVDRRHAPGRSRPFLRGSLQCSHEKNGRDLSSSTTRRHVTYRSHVPSIRNIFPLQKESDQISGDEDISAHITVRVYQPPGAKSDSRLRSVVVWYHGGGWVTGNLDSEDHFCRTMCGQADFIVVSVLYRKFPAIRFPDNLQDCYDGFLWVRRCPGLQTMPVTLPSIPGLH